MEVFLVGGAVRDELLGIDVKERDYVVVGASPASMEAQGYRLIGKDFPVFLHPITQEEYALARTERKTGPGYRGFSCYAAPDVTLTEDLQRRDLTINAIARTLEGKIIDPFHGMQDLNNKILRHISLAFTEDPVRILRVARFMARFTPFGFTIAPETMQLMRKMVEAGEVDTLVKDRVWREFDLALAEPKPLAFLQVLHACGALAVLFPYFNEKILQYELEGTKDTIFPLLQRLSGEKGKSILRFAALMQDIAISMAPEINSIDPVRLLMKSYPLPVLYKELAILLIKGFPYYYQARHYLAKDVLNLFESVDAYRRPDRFDNFLTLSEASLSIYFPGEYSPSQKKRLKEDFLLTRFIPLPPDLVNGNTIKEYIHQQRLHALTRHEP